MLCIRDIIANFNEVLAHVDTNVVVLILVNNAKKLAHKFASGAEVEF